MLLKGASVRSQFRGTQVVPRAQCVRRTVRGKPVFCSAAEEHSTTHVSDWRSFRAKLIASEDPVQFDKSRVCEENLRQLESYSPQLAAEDTWAHGISTIEPGCLLVASPTGPRQDRYWQAVILVVQHDENGTVGLLLNRPTTLAIGGGLAIVGMSNEFQEAFKHNRLYCGGYSGQGSLHFVHGHKYLPGAKEIAPGICVGGYHAALHELQHGRLAPSDFRFFAGAVHWQHDKLQEDLKAGSWNIVSASRSLVLKQCENLPVPLWSEIMQLLGTEHAVEAQLTRMLEL